MGIPTIRDRVAQMAAKLVIEPMFEADFCEHSYGFRPNRSVHHAMDAVAHVRLRGYDHVIRRRRVQLLRPHSAYQAPHGRGRAHSRWCGAAPARVPVPCLCQ